MIKVMDLIKKIDLLDIIMFLSTLFIGADKISIDIAGFNIRLVQVLLIIAFVLLLIKKEIKFYNFKVFLPFLIANLLSVPFSYAIHQSIAYTIWTLYSYVFIWIVYFCYIKRVGIEKMFNILRITFFIQLIYLFIQFGIGMLGIEDPFFGTDIYKNIPRPAIWFYEPSYVATYFTIWFASSLYLVSIKNSSKYLIDVFASAIGLCIITSTTGFLGIGIAVLIIAILYLFKPNVEGKVKILFIMILALGGICLLAGVYFILPNVFEKFILRLFTKGVVSSSGTRLAEFSDMFKAFMARPVFGVGAAAYSEFYGFAHNFKAPSNISLELLATLGILGFASFYYIIYRSIKLLKVKKVNQDIFNSLQFSFIIFMIVLQANQNVLRPYLWMMIGILFGSRQLLLESECGIRIKESIILKNAEGNNMKRILHISNYYPPYIGGIQQTCSDMVESLKGQYEQVVICFNHEKGTKIEIIDGIKIIRVGYFVKAFSQALSISYGKILKNEIKDFDPDYIHFHYPNPFASTCLLSIKFRAKLVIHWHLDITKQKLLKVIFALQNNRLIKRAYKIVATSPKYVEGSKYLKKYPEKIVIIPSTINGSRLIMTDKNYENAKLIKEKYQGINCLFIGRHVKYKGIKYLIKAADYVSNVNFIIAGSGPLTNKLKKQAKKNKNIHFIGALSNDELRENLYACDMFAFPSITKNEAFGLALAEAMYFSKPVITFNIPGSGVNYVSLNNITGFEAQNKDYKEYASYINKLANDEELREKLGNEGHIRVTENFMMDKFKENLKQIYND